MKEPRILNDRQNFESHLKSVKMSFQDPKLQLAAPLTLFIGLEQGFIFGDFTEVINGFLSSDQIIKDIMDVKLIKTTNCF